MAEFNKDAPEFVPTDVTSTVGKLNLVRPTATSKLQTSTEKKDDAVDDITANVGKVKIRHDFEGERKNYRDTLDHLKSGKTFADLDIPPSCLQSLTHHFHYFEPTQIQAETIPPSLAGRNVLAQAQAGSGKSIAFAIGMLKQVDTNMNSVQAICIAPTRHLASQIHDDAVVPLAKYMDPPCRMELAVRPIDPNDRGPAPRSVCQSHVVVGTAGTVIKWIKNKYINAKTVKVFVVDEADEMVKESQGSASSQVLQIKQRLPKDVQNLFFSATYPPDILNLATAVVGEHAVMIKVKNLSDLILEKIFQVKIDVKKRSKVDILEDIYSFISLQQSIVFCETRKQCDEVKDKLTSDGFTCSVIHKRILNADEEFQLFREDKTKVLIATNIFARGIDVPKVGIVINYSVPRFYDEVRDCFSDRADFEIYSHRISRCSRMGNPGTAISFLETDTDRKLIKEIEEYYDTSLYSWDEDDIEELAIAHASLQSGASVASILEDRSKNTNADASNWTA